MIEAFVLMAAVATSDLSDIVVQPYETPEEWALAVLKEIYGSETDCEQEREICDSDCADADAACQVACEDECDGNPDPDCFFDCYNANCANSWTLCQGCCICWESECNGIPTILTCGPAWMIPNCEDHYGYP